MYIWTTMGACGRVADSQVALRRRVRVDRVLAKKTSGFNFYGWPCVEVCPSSSKWVPQWNKYAELCLSLCCLKTSGLCTNTRHHV